MDTKPFMRYRLIPNTRYLVRYLQLGSKIPISNLSSHTHQVKMVADCVNDTFFSCLNLTRAEFDTIRYSMIGLFAVSFVFSCIGVTMLLIIGGLKVLVPRPPSPILQLTLFILVSVFFYNGAELLKAVPSALNDCGEVYIRDKVLCKASGAILEYFSLLTYILAFLTTLFIAFKFIFHCECLQSKGPFPVIILIIGIITSLLVAWIPFVHDKYGRAGAWCWIVVHDNNCNLDVIGLSEEIALYYALVFIISIIMFITAFIILVRLFGCCGKTVPINETQKTGDMKAKLEFIPILIYPIIFSVFFCIDCTQRIYFALYPIRSSSTFGLWLGHAIAGNTACLLVPLAFIVHPLNWMRVCQRLRKCCCDVKAIVETDFSEGDPLLHQNGSSSSNDYQTVYIVPPSTDGNDPLIIKEE